MKINKLFMLGLAGLAFTACSSDEDVTQNGISGLSAVSIKIKAPEMTRTSNATGDVSTVKVVPQGNVTITLGAEEGNNTIELTPEQWQNGTTVTFWNVKNPNSVTVSMNGGLASYDNVSITETVPQMQAMPEAIPVYGTTGSFTTTGKTDSPTANDDHQIGAAEGDEDKTYQMYEATVNLTIPVARLEVSGIVHTDGEDGCRYSTLTINGVYLDNVKPTDAGDRTDYQFLATGSGTGVEAILKEEIPETYTPADGAEITDFRNFLRVGGVWPAEEETAKAYAWNFYGPTSAEIGLAESDKAKMLLNPKFKIYFATATAADNTDPVSQPRYAMITKYKDADGNAIVLQNGHIYRIIGAELTDDNIIGDEDGNTYVGVEVTVTEAAWTVETIEADWAK